MLSPSINHDQHSNAWSNHIQAPHEIQHLLAGRQKQMLKRPNVILPNPGKSASKRPHLTANDHQRYYYETRTCKNSNKMIKLNHHHHHHASSSSTSSSSFNRHQPSYIGNKHLVRTVSDLPVFVTIEGYHIASYSIAGEPHLCLPQLLQYLRQKFSLKRMIEKFEESIINFTSASPKQVDGFIKASVLPPSAKSCPLIKRSDADRICLGLFEQCFKGKKNDIVDMCSKHNPNLPLKGENDAEIKCDLDAKKQLRGLQNQQQRQHLHFLEDQQQVRVARHSSSRQITTEASAASAENNKIYNHQTSAATKNQCNTSLNECGGSQRGENSKASCPEIEIHQTAETKPLGQFSSSNNNSNSSCSSDNGIGSSKVRKDFLSNDKKIQDGNLSNGLLSYEEPSSLKRTESLNNNLVLRKGPLFETEAQNSILALAKAVTSTLMIRVYHRCFGKCIGLYYPSLLTSSKTSCIECISCKNMFEPRRFIGHTHGPKENDVCHWGFNSYNWRFYIRLSRKQTMNNLDDDELLVQFKTLQSAPDYIESGCDQIADESDYDFDQPNTAEGTKLLEDSMNCEKGLHEAWQSANIGYTPQNHPPPPPPPPHIIETTSYGYISSYGGGSNSGGGCGSGVGSCLPIDGPDLHTIAPDIHSQHPPELLTLTATNNIVRPNQPTISECYELVDRALGLNLPGPNLTTHPSVVNSIGGNQLLPKRGSSLSSVQDRMADRSMATSMADAAVKLKQELTHQLSFDIEIQRELYVCANLTSYLNGKGLSSNLINDIVENTLNINRNSRILF